MKLKAKNNFLSKKSIIIYSIIAVALIGVCVVFYLNSRDQTNQGEYFTNLERSDTEKAATENLEKNPEQKLENNQTDAPVQPTKTTESGKQQVNVLLNNAGIYNGKVSAAGMVTNTVEESGSCLYVFTNGNSTITKSSETLTNPTSTTCKSVSFSSDELPASGIWKVTLRYSSDNSEGASAEKEVTK